MGLEEIRIKRGWSPGSEFVSGGRGGSWQEKKKTPAQKYLQARKAGWTKVRFTRSKTQQKEKEKNENESESTKKNRTG